MNKFLMTNKKKTSLIALLIVISCGMILIDPQDNNQRQSGQPTQRGNDASIPVTERPQSEIESDRVWVSQPVRPVLSTAVRDLPPLEFEPGLDREINPRFSLQTGLQAIGAPPNVPDTLLARQAKAPPTTADAFITPLLNFEGQGFTDVSPPDTAGDVGLNHYIQIINSSGGGIVQIYDKTGMPIIAPFQLDALGTDQCATGFGDAIVLYDRLADRWFLSEFSRTGNRLCIYISQTADPTGAYYAYNLEAPFFPDFPKYGVWPSAYFASSNEPGNPPVYALDRLNMLTGSPASSQRLTAPSLAGYGFQALTPADLDGADMPPADSPGLFMRHVDAEAHGLAETEDTLEIWAFDVDFDTPENSTFTLNTTIPITEFDSELCGYTSFSCVRQPDAAVKLDPLREVIMPRLQYRNFGCHETIVGNFVTDVSGTDQTGIRWFELRRLPEATWGLHQEGTYAPDGENRWMGASAMDGAGNIALAYNIASDTTFPSIRYAGRLAGDPLGMLPQGEAELIAGTQSNNNTRYGDYAAMSVDPADECTFWFTGEYNESLVWSTRIGSFKFDSCSATADVCNDIPTAVTLNTTTTDTPNSSLGVILSAALTLIVLRFAVLKRQSNERTED